MMARYFCFGYIVASSVVFGSCSSDNDAKIVNKDSTKSIVKPTDSLLASVVFPKEMNALKKSAFSEYITRVGNDVYTCQYKGKFEKSDTLRANKVFLFDLNAEFLIDKVFFYAIDSATFFVMWQETNHNGVGSNAALYELGNTKPRWKHEYPDPDPGQIAIDSAYAYISTLGMVGKLNMNTGEYLWQHDSLFEPIKMKYKSFDRPMIYTNSVCFIDYAIRGRKNKRDSIWVNDATGKIFR